MKTISNKMLIILLFFLTASIPKPCNGQPTIRSIQVFYDELSPYGHWVANPDYGYVWIPSVEADFIPYASGGYWGYTNYGWTWISTYSWGWATFHYGRWDFNPYYGWFWVPGCEWGPAWVIWRSCPGYYGWMYLKPGHNHTHFSDDSYYGRRNDWTFIEDKNMGNENTQNIYTPRTYNESLFTNSTVIDNTYEDKTHHVTYIKGPSREEFEKNTGITVKTLAIEENSKPGQETVYNNKLLIYRPKVATTTTTEPKPAPSKVLDIRDVKPIAERNTSSRSNSMPKDTPVIDTTPKYSEKQKQPVKTQPVTPSKQESQTKPEKTTPQTPQQKSIENQTKESRVEHQKKQTPPAKKAPAQPRTKTQQIPDAGKKERPTEKQKPKR